MLQNIEKLLLLASPFNWSLQRTKLQDIEMLNGNNFQMVFFQNKKEILFSIVHDRISYSTKQLCQIQTQEQKKTGSWIWYNNVKVTKACLSLSQVFCIHQDNM
jgi:hypothetical protein